MADEIPNRLPWAELVSSVPFSETMKARAAQKFFENKRFANAKNRSKRGLVRRLMDTAFESNQSLFALAQLIGDEIRENSDAKALNACVKKIERLGEEGWHHSTMENHCITLTFGNLTVQLQPDAFLTNGTGGYLLLYSYFRRSPPLSTDAIRALLLLIKTYAAKRHVFQAARIVILDCYNDRSFEGIDFGESEPWIVEQMENTLNTYNAMYRINLDGSPPPQIRGRRVSGRRSRALQANRAGFSIASTRNQLCLQFA